MKYCSNCGEKVIFEVPEQDNRPRYVCSACGTVHYQNPRVVVGTVPIWKDQVLLCRRNIEPRKGFWTLPAGFLENGETVYDGAFRETVEETGTSVSDLVPYLMIDILHVHQIYLMFRARLTTMDFHPTDESSEILLFREEDIPWGKIAFKVIEKTLHSYFNDHATGCFDFRIDKIDKMNKFR
jgi:ADP-ribose pyrophosphatase YjhB (NUDIX family)